VISGVERERQLEWAAKTRDQRMMAGRIWYATRNARDLAHNIPFRPALWDDKARSRRRWQTRRACSVLIALQAGWAQSTVNASAELEQAREQVIELTQRAHAADELIAAHARVAALSQVLLDDDRFASERTGSLALLPRPRGAS
jgi:hypothetical protein